jgi:hypothetical protein
MKIENKRGQQTYARFLASAAVLLKPSLFWDVTLRRLAAADNIPEGHRSDFKSLFHGILLFSVDQEYLLVSTLTEDFCEKDGIHARTAINNNRRTTPSCKQWGMNPLIARGIARQGVARQMSDVTCIFVQNFE